MTDFRFQKFGKSKYCKPEHCEAIKKNGKPCTNTNGCSWWISEGTKYYVCVSHSQHWPKEWQPLKKRA